MKNHNKIITILFLIIILGINTVNLYAIREGHFTFDLQFEIYDEENDSNTYNNNVALNDFNNKVIWPVLNSKGKPTGDYYFIINLYGLPDRSNLPVDSYGFNLYYNQSLFTLHSIELNEDIVKSVNITQKEGYDLVLCYNGNNSAIIPEEKTLFLSMTFYTNNKASEITESYFDFNLEFTELNPSTAGGDDYDLDEQIINKAYVGTPTNIDDASLDSVKISNSSDTLLETLTSLTKEGTASTKAVPYATAKSGIKIEPITKKEDATYVIKDSNNNILSTDSAYTITSLTTTTTYKIETSQGDDSTYYNITINVTPPTDKDDAKLSKLDFGSSYTSGDDYTITPTFSSTTYSYTITVPYDNEGLQFEGKIASGALLTLEDATFSSTKIESSTSHTIKVIAQNGEYNEYVFNIQREDPSSEKTLTIDVQSEDGKTVTKTDNTLYEFSDSDSQTENFKIILKAPNYATINVTNNKNSNTNNSGTSNTLTISNQQIKFNETIIYIIIVKAQDGTENKTTLTIKKNGSSNINFDLTLTLNSSPKNYNFTTSNKEYTYTFSATSGTINLAYPTLTERNQTKSLTLNGTTLTTDYIDISQLNNENTLIISVIAQDGTTNTTYTLNINKQSSDTSLDSFYIRDADDGITYYYQSEDANESSYYENFIKSTTTSKKSYTFEFEYVVNKIYLYLEVNDNAVIISNSAGTLSSDDRYLTYTDTFTTSSGTKTLTVTVKAEDNTELTYEFILIRKAADTDSKLKTFMINGTTVDGWNQEDYGSKTYQKIQIPGTDSPYVTLSFEANSSKAKVSYQLEGGTKEELTGIKLTDKKIYFTRGTTKKIYVYVEAEDGTSSTFVVPILSANSDFSINTFELSNIDYTFNFDNSKTSQIFNIEDVAFTVKTTKLVIELSDSYAKIIRTNTTGNDKDWTLVTGTNQEIVTLKSEDESKALTYTINITKNSARDYNKLSLLTINGEAVTITDSTSYTYRIDDEFETAEIIAKIPTDKGAKITTLNGDIPTSNYEAQTTVSITSGGLKTITIIVQAEDSSKLKTYTITIYRANNTAVLNAIQIDGTDYKLDSSNEKYNTSTKTLTLDKQAYSKKSFDVVFKIDDDKSEISLINQGTLSLTSGKYLWNLDTSSNGNSLKFSFSFKVISQYNKIKSGTDGYTTETYYIEVEKEKAKTDNDISKFEVIIGSENEYTNTDFSNTDLGKLVVGRDTTSVTLKVYIKKEDLSTIEGFNETKKSSSEDDVYWIYEKNLTGSQIDNTISINVKNEQGNTKQYTYQVIRKNQVNSIENIEVVNFDTTFNNATITYNLGNVKYNVSKITFKITKTDKYSILYINDVAVTTSTNDNPQTYEYTLSSGSNLIKIKLHTEYEDGEFGTEYEYIINQETPNTNNDLEKLEMFVDNNNIIQNYTKNSNVSVRMDHDVQTVIIYAYVLNSSSSKILEADGDPTEETINSNVYLKYTLTKILTSQTGTITIKVQSEKQSLTGDSKLYTISYKKQNDNNNINNITITNPQEISQTFETDTTTYNLDSVAYKYEKITFNIEKEDQYAIAYLVVNNGTPLKNTNQDEIISMDASILSGQVNTIVIYLMSEYGTKGQEYTYTIRRNTQDADNTLKDLQVNVNSTNYILSFDKTDIKYVLYIDKDKVSNDAVNIHAEANSQAATLKISNGSINSTTTDLNAILASDKINTYTITVTAEDSSTNTYYIYIYYASNDYSLDYIKIDNSDVTNDFSSQSIELNRSWNIEDFELEIHAKSTFATISIDKTNIKNNNTNDLEVGDNKFNITIVSELGKIYDKNYIPDNATISKTESDKYKVNIIRENPNGDVSLTSLKIFNSNGDKLIKSFTIDASDTYKYEFTDTTVDSIYLVIGTKDSNAKIDDNTSPYTTTSYNLEYTQEGNLDQTISFTVINKNSSQIYTVKLTKGLDQSSNNNISTNSDSVLLYNSDDTTKANLISTFDKNDNSNNVVNVSYKISKVILEVKTEDAKAYVKYKFNNQSVNSNIFSLTQGSTDTIGFIVYAEDGTASKEYQIQVSRAEANTNNEIKSIKFKANGSEISTLNTVDLNDNPIKVYLNTSYTTLEIVPEIDKTASIESTTTVGLINGSEVTKTVTIKAEDGSLKEYNFVFINGNNNADISFKVTINKTPYTNTEFTKTTDGDYDVYTLTGISYKENSAVLLFTQSNNSSLQNELFDLNITNISNTFSYENISENKYTKNKFKIVIEKEKPDTDNKLNSLIIRKNSETGDILQLLDNNLSNVTFDKDVNTYYIKLTTEEAMDLSKVYVSSTTLGKGTIAGNGLIDIVKIDNLISQTINVTVTPESGEINIYIITLISGSAEEGSSNVNLKPNNPIYESEDGDKVYLEQEDPDQQPDPDETIVLKAIELPYEVTFLNLTDITSDPNAKVTPSIINLNQGKQTVEFTVIAENGTTQKYSIDVTRLNAESINDLIELSIAYNGLTKTLINSNSSNPKKANGSKEEFIEYLGRGITEIIVTAKPKSSKATLGDIEFLTGKTISMDEDGLTDILITVVAQDSSTKNYLLTISTLDEEDELEFKFTDKNNNELSQTKTKVDDNNYTITLNDLAYSNDYINLAITPKNEYVKYNESLEGKNYLEAGIENTIIIVSTSENGQNTIKYTIKIKRLAGDDTSLKDELKFTTNNDTYEVVEDTTDTSVIGKVDIPYNEPQLDLRQLLNSDKASVEPIFIDLTTLTPGINKITFTVTGEDKTTTETYNININREDPSSDRTLKDLIITYNTSQQVKLIDNNVYNQDTRLSDTEFKVSLPKWSVSSFVIKLLVTPNDSNTKYYIEEQYNLNVGSNTIKFTVVSEDEEHLDYIININVGNSEIYIDTLKVVDTSDETIIYSLTPEFDKDTFEYDLGTISSDINELKIIAKLSDENGTIVDSKGLKYTEIIGRDERFKIEKTSFGENNIKIIVTSEDGSTKLEYILTYTKEGGGNPNSSDKDLDALRITGTKNTYNLGFIKDTKEYNITLNYEDEQFYVDADYDQYATAIGEGLYSINPGETKTIIVQVTAGNGDKGDEYKLIITREEADIDNTLFSLKVEYDDETKDLDLSLNIFQFELIVDTDVTEINIIAKTNSNKATVSGDGLQQLTETINYFPVVVTAEDGSQKTYLIIVKKNSNDALLKELSVQNKETGNELLLIPNFDPETFTYRIDITDITVSTIEIIATANNNSAVVRGTGEFDLKSGTGQTTDRYKVIVTAEDGTEKEYTISIERNIDPDDSIIVEDLKLMGGNTLYLGTSNSAKQKFNMSTTTYDVQVEYELTNIILSVSNLDGAKIIGDGTYDLVDKETKITFTITSKSKEYSKTYIINVIKEEPDSNALLDNLLINGDFIENFNPNIFNYTYPVVYEDGLTINIDAITQSNNAVVSGNLNNVPISRGTNTIPIKVTAQDGTEKTYNLIVKAQSDANEILNITVEGANGYLELEFNKSIMTYNLEVEYEISYVVIEATASDGAKIYGVGGKQLQEGRNSYSIYATSEYGGNPGKVYEVIINRKTVDDDTSLKSLVVTTKDGEVLAFNIPFSPYTYEYIINLEDDIDPKIKIEAEANSSLSYVGGIGPKNLEALTDGQVSNVFEITVRAQSGNIGKYTIYVGKNIKLNSEASFKEFKLIGSDEIIYLGLDQSAKTIFDNKDVDIIVPYSVNSVTLYATALYNGTIVGDTGTKNFGTSNEVTFEIGVQSQDGTKTLGTFNITITRENPLTDNTLKEIIINGESLEGFNPEVKKYTIDVDYNSVNGIMITANPTEQTALVTGDIGKQVLETGVNTFTINVVSEDGNINSYIVTVNYLSYNAKLDSLVATDTVSGQTLSFNKEFNSKTKEYNLVVDKSIKEVMIEATEQDETALIISGTGKHEVLPNQITKVEIIVLAADNKTKEIYTINISVAGELSDDTTLQSLKVEGLTIKFDKDLRTYTISAKKNFDKTTIEAIASNQNATIEFIDYNINSIGQATLENIEITEGENVLLIKVTAENGESNFYTLKIEKDQTPDYFFLILLIVTFVLWLATILILIIKNQLNKNKDKEEDNTNIYY